MKKGLSVTAIAVATVLALAGCTGGSTPTPSPSSDAVSTGWVRADAANVQDGGTLTLAIDDGITNFNYYNADAGTVDSGFISTLFQPSLIIMNEDGSWKIDPNYATSIETVSEDPQTVAISLNPEAVWSDGTPMTAADYIGMFNALNGKDEAYAPNSTNIWEDVASVEQGATEFDFTITFANPQVDWVAILGAVVPAWLTKDPNTFNTLWQKMPVAADGTTVVSGGPFILESYDTSAQVLTWARNPQWWGATPKLEKIVLRATDRSVAGQNFANKELDVVQVNASADTLNAATARADSTVLTSRGVTFSHITLNGTVDVFSDVKVREAFAKSINRDLIAQALVKPLGVEAEVLNNLMFLPGQDGYADDSEPIAYDEDAAKALLEDAGWTGDGVREKDGKKLEVRFVIPSDNPNSALISQQVQAMVKTTGFDLKIDTVPTADFFTKYINVTDRDFDAVPFAWQGTPFPISSVKSVYYPADSGQNYPGVTDDSLGAMFDSANSNFDPASRLAEAAEIDKKLVALVTTIPLFARPNQYVIADGVVNYGPSQFETVDWTIVGWAK